MKKCFGMFCLLLLTTFLSAAPIEKVTKDSFPTYIASIESRIATLNQKINDSFTSIDNTKKDLDAFLAAHDVLKMDEKFKKSMEATQIQDIRFFAFFLYNQSNSENNVANDYVGNIQNEIADLKLTAKFTTAAEAKTVKQRLILILVDMSLAESRNTKSSTLLNGAKESIKQGNAAIKAYKDNNK
jgi:tetrahydromethanopterin S-methyltransferase subunit B